MLLIISLRVWLTWPSWLLTKCLLLYLNFLPLLSVSDHLMFYFLLCFIHVLCHVCLCVMLSECRISPRVRHAVTASEARLVLSADALNDVMHSSAG